MVDRISICLSVFFLLISFRFCLSNRANFGFLSEDHTIPDLTAVEHLRAQAKNWSDNVNDERLDLLFKQFCKIYNRPYISNEEEYAKRREIFLESLRRHIALNHLNMEEEKAEYYVTYGINKFSDWSEEEFRGLLRSYPAQTNFVGGKEFTDITMADNDYGCTYYRTDPPKSVDWRKVGKVTDVKNQGKCGSCWAFVATEQVESYWAISGRPLTHYSVQEFISCAPSLGCNGGNTCQALAWLKLATFNKTRYHLVPDTEYPYEAKETNCIYSKTSETGATISNVCGCVSMVGNEDIMLRIVAQRGPLGVNVNSIQWRDYIGGIIQRHCSNQTMNHAVQIVGYDLSGPVPYWIVRNTWGKDFGEQGYLRIKYGGDLCGLAEEPSFVVV